MAAGAGAGVGAAAAAAIGIVCNEAMEGVWMLLEAKSAAETLDDARLCVGFLTLLSFDKLFLIEDVLLCVEVDGVKVMPVLVFNFPSCVTRDDGIGNFFKETTRLLLAGTHLSSDLTLTFLAKRLSSRSKMTMISSPLTSNGVFLV